MGPKRKVRVFVESSDLGHLGDYQYRSTAPSRQPIGVSGTCMSIGAAVVATRNWRAVASNDPKRDGRRPGKSSAVERHHHSG